MFLFSWDGGSTFALVFPLSHSRTHSHFFLRHRHVRRSFAARIQSVDTQTHTHTYNAACISATPAMHRACFSNSVPSTLASSVSMSAEEDGAVHSMSTEASTAAAPRRAKQLRHVAFVLDHEADDLDEGEAPRAPRVVRGGGGGPAGIRTAEDPSPSWSSRAEADALRQRALQCGEDFARMASGLGYEVVVHTPTAFLKGGPATTTETAAAAKPDGPSASGFVAAAAPCATGEKSSHMAALRSSLTAALGGAALTALAKPRTTALFLRDQREADSCSSSRSSSPGSEAQVGAVPVLSPLLEGSEVDQRRVSDELALPPSEAVSFRPAPTYRYPAALSVAQSGEGDAPSRSALPVFGSAPHAGASPRPGPRSSLSTSAHPEAGANAPPPAALNRTSRRPSQSTPTTMRPTISSESPSPRPALTPRTTHSVRTPLLVAPGPLSNNVAFRLSMLDVTSSRATSNANTSVSTEHLNGQEVANAMGGSQTANNRFFTPSTDALNVPAVRIADDEDWPRSVARSIQ